jgi:hypothetical protein
MMRTSFAWTARLSPHDHASPTPRVRGAGWGEGLSVVLGSEGIDDG